MIKIFALLIASLMMLLGNISQVAAQNEDSNIQEYTPPPLFGSPRNAPPEKIEEKIAPASSEKIKVRQNEDKPVLAPRISKQVVLENKKYAPLPPRRPKAIVSKANSVPKKEQPKTSAGVVKGPKTMPAVKAKTVEAETVDDEPEKQTDMLARVQKEKAEKEKITKEIEREPREVKILDTSKPNIIIFEPGLAELNESQKDALEFSVLPTLQEKGAKLQIQSFASPANDGFSSDRRISLSRALAVRSFLLEKGFDASRIELRALGAETNKQPFDRIELIFG